MTFIRKTGYLLLILGFGMIVTRLLLQQLDRAGYAWRMTTEVMDALGDPQRYLTSGEVQAHVYKVAFRHAPRLAASLVPGCLMFAGGLLLGIRKQPVASGTLPRTSGASGEAPHNKPGVGELSWDRPTVWRPEPGSSYRRALLGLARRVIERSPFFCERRSSDHVDADSP